MDRYLKEENALLKERVAKLDKQVTEGRGKQAFLAKRVKKWYDYLRELNAKSESSKLS